jgi:biopolymer transport protein ExbB
VTDLHATLHSGFLTLAQEAGTEQARTVVDYIKSGGITGFVILTLSVAAVAICVYLFIELRLTRMSPPHHVDTLGRLFREAGVGDAIKYCDQPDNRCFITGLFAQALRRCSRSQFGLLEMRSALEEGGQRQVEKLYRVCDWVALIAATGPMLGLLGTVFGMIGAFGTISNIEGAARSKQLAEYMSLALVTTALGLVVAIPCTAAFSVFRRRIDRLAEDVGEIAEGLAAELAARLTTPAAAKPPARPAPARPAEAREARVP